jgi:hypothetical protein
MAGGNGIMFALGSPAVSQDAGASTPQPWMAGASTGTITNTSGGAAPLGHVQIAIGAALLLSIAALVLLNKAGFRFSVTVG